MAATPGTTVSIIAGSSNPSTNAPTGVWMTIGVANGPSGMAVPITSLADFTTYFGQNVNGQLTGRYSSANLDSTLLYDSLDVYFREGGVLAYVSRMVPSGTGVQASSTGIGTALFAAAGKGTFANSSNANNNGLIITTTASTVGGNTVYSVKIVFNGNTLATSPNLNSATDIVNWVNSLPAYQSMCVASVGTLTTALPTTGNSTSVYFTGGTDTAVADSDMVAALAVYGESFGVGQVSYPGATTSLAYSTLTTHAATYNRIAVLDGSNTATATTLTGAVSTLQGTAGVDPSYASMWAGWLTVPGIVNSNPSSSTNLVFNRTVPPCSLAAAKMAVNDLYNDCNVPAAGVGPGTSKYAIGVSYAYSSSDRALLNGSGVNVIKLVPNANVIAIYGFRSCSYDPTWSFLNHTRMRMQMVRDFDIILESFVFDEIDGKDQIFAKLNGAIAGQCQYYWTRGSLYGPNSSDAYSVNTGPQVNTIATKAAGQLNAQISARFSNMVETATIVVSKYTTAAPLPSTTNA